MFPSNAVVITAAGSSQRFNSSKDTNTKKEFISLNGKSVLLNAATPFFEIPNLKVVIVTYKKGTLDETKECLKSLFDKKIPIIFTEGGETRQQSVFNALKTLKEHSEFGVEVVSIHDGARPFIKKETIMDCIAYAKLFGGAAPSVPVSDTLVHVNEEGFIDGRLERDGAYQIQTPQCFVWPDIYFAHEKASSSNLKYTDDTMIFADYGKKVAVVAGSSENKKITFQNDIEIDENTIGCTGNCSTCHGLCVKEEE